VLSCYENIARFWIETLFASRRLRTSDWRRFVAVENEPELRSFCSRRAPGILVTGYVGQPGLGAFVLGQFCRPIHVLVDVLAHPVLRAWQADTYRQPNVCLIPRPGALSTLTAVLEAGGKIMIIAEQSRPGCKGDTVTFLGRERCIYQTVRVLSRRYHAPVLPFACFRTGVPFGFVLRCAEPVDPAVPDVSQRTLTALQSLILSHPEQYLWTLPD
jgi:lauroyl/myristoyl acyltransferase